MIIVVLTGREGLEAAALDLHYNHFHIDLRAPHRVDLPQNLLAGATFEVADDALIANAQAWLDLVKADLNLTEGEVTMFIPDMPNIPPQDVPVMIAQANQAQSGDTTKVRTFGVCSPSPNKYYSADNGIIPITSAGKYLLAYENRTPPATATTTIVQPPKHGVLRLVTEADGNTFGEGRFVAANQLYVYLPDPNYVGKDTATIQVDFGGGLKVNVKYFFQVVDVVSNDWVGDYCRKTGPFWKISSTLDADGNSTITSVEYLSPVAGATGATAVDIAALASTLGAGILGSLAGGPADVNVSVTDLAGGALGETTGLNITLDTKTFGVKSGFIARTPEPD